MFFFLLFAIKRERNEEERVDEMRRDAEREDEEGKEMKVETRVAIAWRRERAEVKWKRARKRRGKKSLLRQPRRKSSSRDERERTHCAKVTTLGRQLARKRKPQNQISQGDEETTSLKVGFFFFSI